MIFAAPKRLRFDVMWRGRRHRMPVNDFAIPPMEPRKQRPIQSMEEARDWERLSIGEIKAGRDPRFAPSRSIQVASQIGDVAAFLDAYWERCVKPAGLRSIGSVRSQIAVLKEHLGHLRLAAIEDPDEVNRFKTESDYAEDVELVGDRSRAARVSAGHRRCAWCAGPRLPARAVRLRETRARLEPMS